ncbi:MAG: hypothetical protein NTU41_13770 [Chloroflexi bacterium]|nr:hypothetical protein [Chloroflexota bacterium]
MTRLSLGTCFSPPCDFTARILCGPGKAVKEAMPALQAGSPPVIESQPYPVGRDSSTGNNAAAGLQGICDTDVPRCRILYLSRTRGGRTRAAAKTTEVNEMTGAKSTQPDLQVNLLANLIHWVSTARTEIGVELLPMFLDTYAISGHLPRGLKDAILSLAQVIDGKQSDATGAEAWSRLALELHGILTGDSTPAQNTETVVCHEDEKPQFTFAECLG